MLSDVQPCLAFTWLRRCCHCTRLQLYWVGATTTWRWASLGTCLARQAMLLYKAAGMMWGWSFLSWQLASIRWKPQTSEDPPPHLKAGIPSFHPWLELSHFYEHTVVHQHGKSFDVKCHCFYLFAVLLSLLQCVLSTGQYFVCRSWQVKECIWGGGWRWTQPCYILTIPVTCGKTQTNILIACTNIQARTSANLHLFSFYVFRCVQYIMCMCSI